MIEGYLVGRELNVMLGCGQTGVVVKASKDGCDYAMKIIKGEFDFKTVQKVKPVVENLMKLMSPFLVKNIDSFIHSKERALGIVMELCGKNVDHFMKKLNSTAGSFLAENRLKKIMIQLLLGLSKLHEHKIVHRNIKPSNVFIGADDAVKLGDYVLKDLLDERFHDKDDATYDDPFYLAPEVFLGTYDLPADVWSLGVLLYYLCTKELPFKGTKMTLKNVVLKGKYSPISSENYSEEVRGIISSMLNMTPLKRPTVTELLMMNYMRSSVDEHYIREHYPKGLQSSV